MKVRELIKMLEGFSGDEEVVYDADGIWEVNDVQRLPDGQVHISS